MNKHWTVVVEKRVIRQLSRLPKGVVEILDQMIRDLESEGPTPRGWMTKHVKGRGRVYSIRLKREYRALYKVTESSILVISVAHRKEVY